MLGNLHVRFGGGRLGKGPQGHLAGRLPYPGASGPRSRNEPDGRRIGPRNEPNVEGGRFPERSQGPG